MMRKKANNKPRENRVMHIKTLTARFDGKQIKLDEPFKLPKDARLLVVVLPPEQQVEAEHDDWVLLANNGLKNAYADDEIEYSPDLIKEKNPEYEGR